MDNIPEETYIKFHEYLEEANFLYPEYSNFAKRYLCWKLALDGNLDETTDPEEIEKIKSKYIN
jgi:hypothetical protein